MESSKGHLLPIAYLAPISYYAILLQNINVKIEIQEYFIKQSIRNRCYIYASNGILTLSVPRKRKSNNKIPVKEVQISYTENWQKKHWKTIQSAYNSSPFFEYYKDEISPFYRMKYSNLIEFNCQLQECIINLLGIEYEQSFNSSYQSKPKEIDYRNYKFINDIIPSYIQVFNKKYGFINNLSIIDLLFNLGPESLDYLKKIKLIDKKQ